jgi:Ca-activated chloride channel family protein
MKHFLKTTLAAKLLLTMLMQLMMLMLMLLSHPVMAMTLNEVGTGELLFKTATGWQPSLRLGTRVDMQVNGMLARVTVEQRFQNTQTEWAEGNYVFPLPETAAVSEMTITVDNRIIVGEIHEKRAAEKIYRDAKAAGKRAALLEQNKPNLFRTKVANLGPQQEISVTITYLEKVRYENGEFSLRFPMTITKLFDASAAAIEPPSQADEMQPLYELPGVPRNPVQITARIDAGLPLAEISSPHHSVLTERDNTRYLVALANNVVPMDRDFVLRWRPTASTSPQAAIFAEEIDGDTYAMLMIMPPEHSANRQRLAREIIFVVDTSGSMQGASIEAAREALNTALGTLGPNDRFNVIAFDDDATLLFPEAKLAAGSYLQDGWAFINNLEADNGTNMEPALRAALEKQPSLSPGMLRQVVFITDGAVRGEDKLFRLIKKQLGQSRLFTVGIGGAPNSHFMRKAAQFGRGSFTYIATPAEVDVAMSRLFEKLAGPQLQDLQVIWPGSAESFPARIPDLYAGEPLVITARIDGTHSPLLARMSDGNDQWQQQVRLSSVSSYPGIATLWARDKLDALYDRITTNGENPAVRNEVVAIGLRHKLISRYTSFVAVERTPIRPMSARMNKNRVQNALPAGQVLALPQTATSTFENLLLGSLCLLLAFVASRTGAYAGARSLQTGGAKQ